MFIEKEGFLPLLKAVRLAERYDIAIMSTKGMPVVACRHLADVLCGEHDIPLLVLHDFDKAGFSILGTLQDVDHDYQFDEWCGEYEKKRYEFDHDIDVTDLGLRLADVEAFSLESEIVTYRSDPSDNLRENGVRHGCATDARYGRPSRRLSCHQYGGSRLILKVDQELHQEPISHLVGIHRK
ncbi:MAG: toprim domain-containing protein [Planctomycetota bacterium]|jgi:hypothetical protein